MSLSRQALEDKQKVLKARPGNGFIVPWSELGRRWLEKWVLKGMIGRGCWYYYLEGLSGAAAWNGLKEC